MNYLDQGLILIVVALALTKLLSAKSPRMLAQLTEELFSSRINDWEWAVKPAYTEHKIALGYPMQNCFGVPNARD